MSKYKTLADAILPAVGGKDNITFFTHCMTRLRFNVKDKSIVQVDTIEKFQGVIGTKWADDQIQIIVGTAVEDIYREICKTAGLNMEAAVEENLDNGENGNKQKKKTNIINAVLDAITGAVTPILPIFIGCGLLKAVVAILTQTGVMTAEMPTCQVLTFVGDAGFYFLPVFIGATAAKKFGANMSLGMLLGAMMIHPAFISAVTEGTALSIFKIPIFPASYTSSIFPVVMSVYVMSIVQKFIGKRSPKAIRNILEPFGTLIVMIPLTFCIIGPIGDFIGTYLGKAVFWLYDVTGFAGVAIFAAILPLMVITGTHHGLSPYIMNSFATLGYEPLYFTASSISNINEGIACLAVAARTKKADIRANALSAAATALICGVTEPALFGVNLRYRTPLYGCMIGSFIGAGIAGAGKAVAYLIGGGGVFSFTSFLSGDLSNVLWFVGGALVGAVIAFISTFIMYKDEEEGA